MPYKVIRKGNKWLTINEITGKIKGTHDSKHKAIAQMKLLYGIKSGIKPRGKVRKKRKA
ncbi:MAG: hypothetical protein LRZ94_01140 [Candidatus Pacebacteria bacterium]|nr:hypothetical protein [Candidatus Paceibacterota bacterium]